MRVAFELEFPDEQAADAFHWLQNLPAGWAARWKQHKTKKRAAANSNNQSELSETEQKELLYKVFGGWQSDVSGEEMVRQIYEDRRDAPREVNL